MIRFTCRSWIGHPFLLYVKTSYCLDGYKNRQSPSVLRFPLSLSPSCPRPYLNFHIKMGSFSFTSFFHILFGFSVEEHTYRYQERPKATSSNNERAIDVRILNFEQRGRSLIMKYFFYYFRSVEAGRSPFSIIHSDLYRPVPSLSSSVTAPVGGAGIT